MRRLLLVFVLALLAVSCSGAGGVVARGAIGRPAVPVRVGTGPQAESVLLAHILAGLLDSAGVAARVVRFGDDRDAREAIEVGDVDVVPGYSGAVWLDELGWADPPADPTTSYERVKLADERHGLLWLERTGANPTFAFVAASSSAGKSLDGLDDLALAVNTDSAARLCVDFDFATRSDGLASLARVYAIRDEVLTQQVVVADPRRAVAAVEEGACLAGLATVTDGWAWAAGLRVLADGQRAFPAFVVAAVVRQDVRDERPEVVAALEPFAELSDARLASWNGAVVLGESVEVVAERAAADLRAAAGGS